jgi:DNA invertase Pin-like site-specific DNA recombinase
MNNAAIYRRVSGDEQAESGHGLDAQEDAARAYAARQGWNIIGVFTDAGVTGSVGLEKRPAMLEAIAALKQGDVLLVAKRDRIGRLEPLPMAMIEAAVKRAGARIISAAGEGTESDDPSSVLMRRMVDAFAEYERLIIKARTKAALQAKRRRGEKTGGACPFGFQLAADGIHLEPCPEEQADLALIRQLRADGMTLQAIAAELNMRGIRRRGGSKWDHRFLSELIRREAA